MSMVIVKLMLLFCFSSLGLCFIQNEPYLQARPYGVWSKYITSQQNLNDDPSQYFLCGVQLKKRIQMIKVQRFRWRSWYRILRSDLFSKTQIHRDMTNAINFFFCHYSNWTFQKIKTFNTNDNSTSQWNDKILCPNSYYARGVTTVFSVLHGVDQGITGIRLHCMPMTLDHEVTVQDISSKLVGSVFKSKNGSFISALKVKYVNNSEIVGLMLNTEYATRITSLNFTYQNLQKKTKTPTNFSTLSKKNFNSQKLVQIIESNKQIQLKNIWQPDREYLLGYRISAQPQINMPNIQDSNKQKQKQSQIMKIKEKFQFGKQLIISQLLNFSAMTTVNSCTQVCLNTIYDLVQFEIFFDVLVAFGRLVDRGQVSIRKYTGVWRGSMISDIEHQIQSTALQDCYQINHNLRKQSSP